MARMQAGDGPGMDLGWGWSWLGFPEMIQKWLCHGKPHMDDDREKALFEETTMTFPRSAMV